jgi:hypothetical protein
MGCILLVVADFNHNTLFQSRPEVRAILGLLVTLWLTDLEGSDRGLTSLLLQYLENGLGCAT